MLITGLPCNPHFNEKCLIFNSGVIPAHYKYTCILDVTTPEDSYMSGQNTIVTAWYNYVHKTKEYLLVFLVNFIHQKCYAVWTFLNLLVSKGNFTLKAYSLSNGQIGASSRQRWCICKSTIQFCVFLSDCSKRFNGNYFLFSMLVQFCHMITVPSIHRPPSVVYIFILATGARERRNFWNETF